MMNEVYKMTDEIYSLNQYIKLRFNLSTYREINGVSRSFYSEYKTNSRKEGCVMINRKLEYFLTLDYNYKGEKRNVIIYPEHMMRLIERFTYITNNWLVLNHSAVFGMVNGHLSVVSQCESIIIQFPCEKCLRIDPYIEKKEDSREYMALIFYVGDSDFPVKVTSEKFAGLLYTISNISMANYANTLASSLVLMGDQSYNRVSFDNEKTVESQATSTGKAGRDFKFKSNGFFD